MNTAKTYLVGRELRNAITWWLPVIGIDGLGVYVYVAHRCNVRTGSGCFESVENIARALGTGRNKVRIRLHELERCGLLTREPARHQMPNTYRPRLPVPQPSGLTELVGLTHTQGLTVPASLAPSGLTESTHQASRNRETNRRVLTESDTARVRAHLYEVLKRMNRIAPTPSYARDGQQAKRHVEAHGLEHVLAVIDAFPDYWPTSWIARKTPGAFATAGNFWKLFDEIPLRAPGGADDFVPLSQLATK